MRLQVENGFTLLDPTGHPTTWGRWNPGYVNLNASAHDDRGRQSLEMLGYLLSAFRLTNKTLYLDAIHELVDETNQYDLNLINAVRCGCLFVCRFNGNRPVRHLVEALRIHPSVCLPISLLPSPFPPFFQGDHVPLRCCQL